MTTPTRAAEVEPVGSAPPLTGPTMMGQRWADATFLHWAVPPSRVAPMMPPGVEPDVLDGVTYVALVPFRMVGAGVGRGPGVPWAGTFLETNVRLYSVDGTGRRGIVFRSLDADRLAVVAGARAAFGLPYRWSRMAFGSRPGPDGERELAYLTRLRRSPLLSRVVVRVGDPLPDGGPDADLAAFLTSRWGLHEAHLGRTWHVPNEHEAWPLRDATVLGLEDDLVAAAGFPELAGRPPDSVLHSPGVRVRFGLPGDARRPRPAVA